MKKRFEIIYTVSRLGKFFVRHTDHPGLNWIRNLFSTYSFREGMQSGCHIFVDIAAKGYARKVLPRTNFIQDGNGGGFR
jgi:hypothetical protein